MSATALTDLESLPWIKSWKFDTVFIFGVLFLALFTGLIILFIPQLFYPILVIDLWFLGYHHVVATFTRLCFDKRSFHENRFLVLGLGPIIAVATLIVAWQFGLWVIITIYFYWQWWHYTRQSWGISRIYRGKDRHACYEDGWIDQAIFYAVPVLGILYRCNQDQALFLGHEIYFLPVPDWLFITAASATAILLVFWVARRWYAAKIGRLAPIHSYFMLTHFTIFASGYLFVKDITLGWLIINIWHNAQYILLVWMYNNRRFKDGVDPQAKFLSYISQTGRIWLYMLACLAITGVLYWGVLRSIDWLFFAGLSATIVLYQIVNFHHYVVDSLIWKVRKPKIRENLNLT